MRHLSIMLLLLGLMLRPACAEDAALRVLAENAQSPAKDFTIQNLSGDLVSLSDYKGKLVLLNFWATWCVPCLQEMPSMEQLYQKYQARGLAVLAVCVGEVSPAQVQRFLHRINVTFPVLLDPQDQAGSQYQVSTLPVSYLIDQDGRVVARVNGSLDWTNVETENHIARRLAPK